LRTLSVLLATFLVTQPLFPQQPQQTVRPTFSINTNVVVTNVTVLDRNGNPIENLTKDDFQL
jgi:hypothetical protein